VAYRDRMAYLSNRLARLSGEWSIPGAGPLHGVTSSRRPGRRGLGKRVCAQAQGLQVLLTKYFAGVNRPHSVFESHIIQPLMRNGW
jgi:hypothetical protein